MNTSSPLIQIENVTAYRKDTKALNQLSFNLDVGENVAILGPNGAGKSSLLKLISRDIYPLVSEHSSIRLFGESRIHIEALRRKYGLVSQDLQNDYTPYTSGFDVVLSGLFGAIGGHERFVASDDQRQLALQMVEQLGVSELKDRMFQRLSTGQQRRFLVARALIHKPQLLILDEPTSGLDIGASFDLLAVIRAMASERVSILMATHHIDEIVPEIERVALLSNGRIVVDGPKEAVLTSANLSDLYGTRLEVVSRNGWYQVFSAL